MRQFKKLSHTVFYLITFWLWRTNGQNFKYMKRVMNEVLDCSAIHCLRHLLTNLSQNTSLPHNWFTGSLLKHHRCVNSDETPWRSQRMSRDLGHAMRHIGWPLRCAICTELDGQHPSNSMHSSFIGCSPCDNIPFCTYPPRNNRSKSCRTAGTPTKR